MRIGSRILDSGAGFLLRNFAPPRRGKWFAGAILLLGSSVGFCADIANQWSPTFALELGGYWATADTTVRLDSTSGSVGTTLDFEDNLGLSERKTSPWVQLTYRFNPRHRLEASYVSLRRAGARTLSATINFGDNTYPVNTTVNSEFNTDVYRLAYGYSFINDRGKELAVLLGVHTTRIETSLITVSGTLSESASGTAPLPTVGLQGAYPFTGNLRVNGWFQLFSIKVGDYKGKLTNASAALEYMAFKNLVIGAGYSYYGLNLEAQDGDFRGEFDYNFRGPTLFGRLNF